MDPEHDAEIVELGAGYSPDSGPSSSTDTPPASSAGAELMRLHIRRKPIPRKGHTKSRRGCLNCKRRKVKCQETQPECENCTRIGLVCAYPDARPRSAKEAALALIASPAAPLADSPTMFSYTDLRFFHHFLVAGYPPLPLMGEELWRNVAVLSHSHDYLMHAMLGMAASHLAVFGGDFESDALAHRVQALQSLNKVLCTPARSTAEADARFAAMFALAFQASCMPEGMTEFFSLIKGCHLIGTTSLLARDDSLFRDFSRAGYAQSVRKFIGAGPVALGTNHEILLDDFLKSLRALAPLCTNPLEIRFMASTERVVKLARISAPDAFAEFASHYRVVTLASNEEYFPFMDPTNYPAQLLLIHFMLIEFAIGYIALGRYGRRWGYRERVCITWMRRVADALPDEYREYAKWPMDFVNEQLATGDLYHLPAPQRRETEP